MFTRYKHSSFVWIVRVNQRVRVPTTLSDRATPTYIHILLIEDLETTKVNADVSILSHRVIGEVNLGSMEDHIQPDPVR